MNTSLKFNGGKEERNVDWMNSSRNSQECKQCNKMHWASLAFMTQDHSIHLKCLLTAQYPYVFFQHNKCCFYNYNNIYAELIVSNQFHLLIAKF